MTYDRQWLIDQIMPDVDSYVEHMIAEHNRHQEEKRAHILKKEDWYDCTDAMVWAEKFVEMHTGKLIGTGIDYADEEFMTSWFANAMAAATRRYEYAEQEEAQAQSLLSSVRYYIKHGKPCPMCTGNSRETLDMVCELCGTDYSHSPAGRVMTPPRPPATQYYQEETPENTPRRPDTRPAQEVPPMTQAEVYQGLQRLLKRGTQE